MTSLTLFLLLLALAATFYLSVRISVFMGKRAICKVVNTFRANDAFDPQRALPLEEMGLTARPKLFSLGLRDYKPYAVQALMQAQVIQATFDDRYYLSEKEEEDLERRTKLSCDIPGIPRVTPESRSGKVKR